MAHARSMKMISMIKWIQTSKLSIKNSLSAWGSRFGVQGSRKLVPTKPSGHIKSDQDS